MRGVLIALAAACLLLGVGGAGALAAVVRPVVQLSGAGGAALGSLREAAELLWRVGALAAAVAAAALALLVLRRRVLTDPAPGTVSTWDCGYAVPSPRMQYTASSFAEPLTRLFGAILNLRESQAQPTGVFPIPVTFTSHTADVAEGVYARIFSRIAPAGSLLRRLEAGTAQLHVLYTVLAAIGLLAWGLL